MKPVSMNTIKTAAAGLLFVGAVAGIGTCTVKTKLSDKVNNAQDRIAVRDSFNLTAKQFDELEQVAKKRSWQFARDTLERLTVRDSFNLSPKQFDKLGLQVKEQTITWKQALDSLKRVKP